MGKRARKTRWRTLEIDSDSEESTTVAPHASKGFQRRPFYATKHAFSSQSTPTRRLGFGANGYDAKSTRSSSTASDTKLTFNEDEYTKITTPRQDVLFKKGYLNKPKTYQTQTSTGNSTASTGNSTGNGTPDHQSADGTECTDVEYESQFVFPNAFVDHNGIYYINSFEPYPLVVYNPQLCYPEFGVSRSKRLSTGSLTESTSPNNEEVSQDLSQSGGETSSLYNAGTYQTYGQDNSTISDEPVQNGSMPTEPRKIKKRRRRRISKAAEDKSSSSEDYDSSEEPVSQIENNQLVVQPETEERLQQQQTNETQEEEREEQEQEEEETKTVKETNAQKPEAEEETNRDEAKPIEETETKADREEKEEKEKSSTKFNLNAEEFVPRALRTEPLHLNPNLQFVNVHPNFVPLPFVNHPLSEIGAQGFPPGTFLPPGIPLGFLPHSPQPNFINFVPNQFYAKPFEATVPSEKTEIEGEEKPQKTSDEKEVKIEEEKQPQQQQPQQPQQQQQQQPAVVVQKNQFKNDVDIAKIVSKLEEAAKEQRQNENGLMKRGFRNQKFHPKSQRRTGFYSDQRAGYEKRKFEKRRTNYYQSHHQENEDETAKGAQKETKPKEEIIPPPSSSSSSSTPKKFPYHRNVKETQSIPPAPSASSTHQLNYSEMLKKSSQGKNLHGNQKAEKLSEKIQSPAKAKSEPKESKICPKSPNNQWISVSNRKKRKSKTNNDEETEVLLEEEKEEVINTEIEEVLILTKEEEEMIKSDVQRIEEQKETETVQKEENKDIIELIRESTPVKTILHQNDEEVTIKDVQEIEKEMLKESIESIEAQKKDCVGSNKKKGKKIVSKRVLVKDGDFVASQEETNSVKDVVEEKPKQIVEELKETEVVEKKKPKKKKKPTKPTPTAINNNSNSNANHSSQSSSSATLNSEETYDFLIDSATIVEDKTNEEVSEEFDKIIQRGLFGGLEEKIKSLNGAVDEEFFRSINFNAQAKQTPEKGFIKAGDLSTILKQQAKKPVENWEISKDCASLDLSSEEKARSKGKEGKGKSKSKGEDKVMISNDGVVSNGERKCDFLDSKVEECVAGILNEIVDGIPEVEEIKIDEVDEEEEEEGKVLSNTASMSIEEIDQIFHELKNDLLTETVNSDVNTPKICTKTYEKFETQEEETSQKSITEAVVEWLKKTKERTPEVEILKSPDTINREFHRSIDDDDDEEEEENADVEEADEIFETNSNDKIEVGEDVLKAFDGDGNFLEIREEFEKRTKRGDLPYRAICCSLM